MKICAYVQDVYAKKAYKNENYNRRSWPGFEMVLDVLRRAGHAVEYAGKSTVHLYDVVLISITSDCDWWSFIAEREQWLKGDYKVIAGGAGVLNIKPFLSWVDVFVFGRAENLILNIIREYQKGNQYTHESICYSNEFKNEKSYMICQANKTYDNKFILANGKTYSEQSIGCPNKCYFCGYTWQRRYIGDGTFTAGADSMSSGNRERTILELVKISPEEWQKDAPVRIVGLDGMSESMRMNANKKITREIWREFLSRLAYIKNPHQVKVYCIVGYPNETIDDWRELVEDIRIADEKIKQQKQWSLVFHITPFRPMPATPAATWEMSYENYRGEIAKRLKQNPKMKGNIFYQGNAYWCVEGMGTDSLAAVILSAICLRGDENDAENIRRLAITKKYWALTMFQKQKTLEKYFDCDKLFGKYTWDTVPTKYLKSYIDYTKYGNR
jgi:radical SAM superfamily enzyme YgiQ (UPF0313 family)